MMNLVFEEMSSIDEISHLRNQYLDGLLEAQELYLELMVRNSKIFAINSDNRRIGYFLFGEGTTLLEYFVIQEYFNHVDSLLGEIIEKFSVQKALCKSFDLSLLSCCVRFHKTVKAIGILFREYEEKTDLSIFNETTIRLAESKDVHKIIQINEGVFDHDEEVGEYIRGKKVFLFEKDEDTIGFGIFARVIAGRPECDIGMLVDKKYRRQGYGEGIIHYLANYCQQNGWRAICGCAIENEGSRRCLEKAGFCGRYRLLEFTF
jgi:GNAT superfamily N-acetyltransferase